MYVCMYVCMHVCMYVYNIHTPSVISYDITQYTIRLSCYT